MAEYALLLALPVTIFVILAFVVFSFTFGESNFTLYQVAFPVHGGANAGVTFLLHSGFYFVELAAMKQQFATAVGLGDKVRGSGGQRLNIGAKKQCLAILNVHVAIGELNLLLTNAFNFPAH